MKIDSLSFYKVHHNEDAYPYIYKGEKKGFIAVADGLGGSGSNVHNLSEKCKKKLKNFISYLFFEHSRNKVDGLEDLFKYVSDYVNPPIVDGEPDSSALWGSRVAISRFAYYMRTNPDVDLADENIRRDICKFINVGMMKIAKEYDLKIDGSNDLLVLPTTLSAIRYEVLDGGKISAEVIWAGDSRAYALIPNKGMVQLSKDDETKTGEVSNGFAIKDGKCRDSRLNYKRYILPPKSSIFVCSDGIFEAFDNIENIGVEAVLLDSISQSESFDGMAENWYEFYRHTGHDDCTVAFLSFGNACFAKFKNLFKKRAENVISVFNDYYNKYGKYISVVEGIEEDYEEYAKERAKQRIEEISGKIAEELLSNPNSKDVTVTSNIRGLLGELGRQLDDQFDLDLQNKKAEVGSSIIQRLLDNSALTLKMFADVDNGDGISECIKAVKNTYKELTDAESNIRALNSIQKELAKTNEELNLSAINLEKRICERKEKIVHSVYEYDAVIEKLEWLRELAAENYLSEECGEVQNLHTVIYNCNLAKKKAQGSHETFDKMLAYFSTGTLDTEIVQSLYPCDIPLFEDLKALKARREENAQESVKTVDGLAALNLEYGSRQDAYISAVQNLEGDKVISLLSHIDKYIAKEFVCGVTDELKVERPAVTKDLLGAKIYEYFSSNPMDFEGVIEKVINSSEATAIDGVFNNSKLSRFRELKKIDMSNVKRLIFEINILDRSYNDVDGFDTEEIKKDKNAVDFVFCISSAVTMDWHMKKIKGCIWDFMNYTVNNLGSDLIHVRAKTISFRDYGWARSEEDAMERTVFFNLPNDLTDFADSLSIELKNGGDDEENGLEALYYAMKSKFKADGNGDRQFIILFSATEALKLGERRESHNYPKDMTDSQGLLDIWNGGGMYNTLNQQNKRLIIVSPSYDDPETAIYENLPKTYDKTLHTELNKDVFDEQTFKNWLHSFDED